jgi:hypothetical protein
MSRPDKYGHLKKLIQAFSEPCQGTVYHYTGADGISGIVDNHQIWMSNTAFTNDTTELKALANAPETLLDNDFTNGTVKEEWRKRIEEWREGAARTPINEMTRPTYYMASFSRRSDSLEQWRAYGNFRIGFDAEKLAVRRLVFFVRMRLRRRRYPAMDIGKGKNRWVVRSP